ncbi:MAG: class I SAM-dependent methyltransferase [Verrucomicrobiota bacterium]|nr:class I SAM-dependent methyltransferase [Verrucomicrobiota bacterium]
MSSQKLSARLTDILVCPACHGELDERRDRITCRDCAGTFSVKQGVRAFLPEPIEVAPLDHSSNPLGPEFEAILREGEDFVLNIGAGGSAVRYPNCVEFEHKIFRHTDVVGDAHHLPFRDNVFDRVFAFNVFEHLTDPKKAAEEILRVLKPGGAVAVHTAFLQALHEAPFHFFNATEFGVRQWFANYEIEACHVSANFGPGVMLAFLLSTVMEAARTADATWREMTLLSESTIGEWAEFWKTRGEQPHGFSTLQHLPEDLQKRIAAGFELLARKPAAPTQ